MILFSLIPPFFLFFFYFSFFFHLFIPLFKRLKGFTKEFEDVGFYTVTSIRVPFFGKHSGQYLGPNGNQFVINEIIINFYLSSVNLLKLIDGAKANKKIRYNWFTFVESKQFNN